jgi:hypothetical protein
MFKGPYLAVPFPVEEYIGQFPMPVATVALPFCFTEKETFAGFPIGDHVPRIAPFIADVNAPDNNDTQDDEAEVDDGDAFNEVNDFLKELFHYTSFSGFFIPSIF